MRSETLALLAIEVRRCVFTRRYAAVLGVFGYFAWRITKQMLAYESATQVGYNAWDVFIGLAGGTQSPLPPAVVFPTLLVFLLGGTVSRDVSSGLSFVVQSRLARPNSYWWVKLASVVLVTAMTVFAVYVMSLLLGVAAGLDTMPPTLSSAGGHPDAWRIARGVPPVYYSLPKDVDIVTHGVLVAGYFAFAYTAVVVFSLGVTVRSKKPFAPLAVCGVLVASGLAMSYAANDVTASLSLLSALTESSHRSIPAVGVPASHAVPWSHSVMLLAGLLAVGVAVGTTLTPTRLPNARRTRPRIAAARGLMLLAAAAIAITGPGCAYRESSTPELPVVPPVSVPALGPAEAAQAHRIAAKAVELGVAVDAINDVWGPRYLRVEDDVAVALLERRLARVDRILCELRTLETPDALADWRRLQFAPGLEQLQYVIENAPGCARRRDHVGLRDCLARVERASACFSAAGQSLATAETIADQPSGTGTTKGGPELAAQPVEP